MSVNKTFLPSVQELQNKYAADKENTYRWLKKSDCFLGDIKAIHCAEHLMQQFENAQDKNIACTDR